MKLIKTISIQLLNFLLLQSVSISYSQSGLIDTSFNVLDNGKGQGDGPNNSVWALAAQTDGKVIIGGEFNSYNGVLAQSIARLNTDGSIDTSFKTTLNFTGTVFAIAIQNDKKILIAGSFYYNSVIRRIGIARLNSDGSIDSSFDPGSGVDNRILSLAIQHDGKIIIGGKFLQFNGINKNGIARLNSNGSLDLSFNSGNGADEVKTIAIQKDGKIIAGGNFEIFDKLSKQNIVRLNTDGSVDNSFNIGKGFTDDVNSILIQSDNQIIVGGNFNFYNDSSRTGVAKLNIDGSLDNSFVPNGQNYCMHIALQLDGKIVLGGSIVFDNNGNLVYGISRLNQDGSKDLSFKPDFNAFNSYYIGFLNILIQSDGKLLLGMYNRFLFGSSINNLIRLNSNGSRDNLFNPNTGSNGWIYSTTVQNDGKIIVAGWMTLFNGTSKNFITRLRPNGTLDPTFNIGVGCDWYVNTTLIQPNGKILVGGSFNEINKIKRRYIARINTDGSLDNSFIPGIYLDNPVEAMALQGDGKIILCGNFPKKVIRLNQDGSLDNSFNIVWGPSDRVKSIAILKDGKILIGGLFKSFSGITRPGIARLNSNGDLDNTFDPKIYRVFSVNSIEIQNDNKILIGGDLQASFSSVSGIARLNLDGSIDPTFNFGKSGTSSEVNKVILQSDNKIIIVGDFKQYNNVTRNRLAKLNSDGTLDISFDPGVGADGQIYTASLQTDGNILIGGEYTSYNGVGKNRIARILNSNISAVKQKEKIDEINIFTNPISNEITINYGELDVKFIRLLSIQGNLIAEFKQSQNSIFRVNFAIPKATYIIEIATKKQSKFYKIIL